MKIETVRTHLLQHRLAQPFHSAFSTFRARWACLVEITCDDGTTGWGECLGPAGPNAATVAAMAELLVGRDPLAIEPLWLDIYNQFRDQGQRGLTMTAQSGIDIALWDIAGRHFGVPVHVLLGGAHRLAVPAYATGGFPLEGRDAEAALREELAGYRARGFRAAKIKIGFGLDGDARRIAAAREVLGPDIALMIDANHGYDAIEAIALGNRVAEHGIGWFEEPVMPEHLAAYREVRAGQPIPVAGGETWHGRRAFADALAARAVDVLQPDVCGCGGITEMRKIVAMAETEGVRVVPHVWGTGVAIAAALQMLAVLPPSPPRHVPRAPLLEFDQTDNPFREAVLAAPFTLADGAVAVPAGPGLGIEIDRAALARFAPED
ncbi:D-galactarolactone cycloisomerase [Paralimibaculum aggregatum]|uniref:D-galactarolactone cycloisomerase n=1 Tax=Paralimibaculum aggregatum TaxID=3036245 RepID=A0ABQ6LSV4_9RHOB|nr:mandelate racemase/muconate lactonizing enzyme family protein [Limibaculum sp. NKW23]GMG85152.1 D-galactarolactone cycloisomerase [Limibaculum sp. NKW23]